nr:transposase [Halomonas qijiaojingensis]
MADRDHPRTYREFAEMYPDDATCAAWLGLLRWPSGFICPACGTAVTPHAEGHEQGPQQHGQKVFVESMRVGRLRLGVNGRPSRAGWEAGGDTSHGCAAVYQAQPRSSACSTINCSDSRPFQRLRDSL